LFLEGIVVTLVPLISGILFGHYVLRLDSVQLPGGVAGAQTIIAGVVAVQEKSESPIATLGYSYTVCTWTHPPHHMGHDHRLITRLMEPGPAATASPQSRDIPVFTETGAQVFDREHCTPNPQSAN
jgi:hypothetical protein